METNTEKKVKIEEKAHVKRDLIHQGKIISLVVDEIDYGEPEKKRFDIVLHPGAVVMIPIDEDGRLIFVKQWRRAIKQILLELPAGTLEANEDPKDCAQRELREEISYGAKSITSLGGFYTAPGFCTEYLYLYLAEDLYHAPLNGEDTHEIDVVKLTLAEALSGIEKREIQDAKTIAGIYRYQQKRFAK